MMLNNVRQALTHEWQPAPVIINHTPASDHRWGWHCSAVKDALYCLLEHGEVEMKIQGGISYWRLSA